MKTCLIRQSAGIGDIFFCQKIGQFFKDQGFTVIWPVTRSFSYINQYMDKFYYPCETEDFPLKDLYLDLNIKEIMRDQEENNIFIPLHGHNPRDHSVMRSKYKLVNLDWSDWLDYFDFKRNHSRENKLFYDVLQIKDGEKYTFVNKYFASPPQPFYRPIPVSTNYRIINLEFIKEFTLFDWCKVIEGATEIFSAETSINYLVEYLNIKANKLEMFSKHFPSDYSHIDGLFKKKWSYN